LNPEIREYVLVIIRGMITMFSGDIAQPIFASFVRKEFTAPIFLVGLAVSGYCVGRMLVEFPIGAISDRIALPLLLLAGRFIGIFGTIACSRADLVPRNL
jgi:MFS family permease